MALLTAVNREAQQEIMNGLFKVSLEHTKRSRDSLTERLNNLAKREDMDAVITHFRKSANPCQPEFGLAFFKKDGSAVEGKSQFSSVKDVGKALGLMK